MDKNHKGYQEALRRIDFVKQSMGTENEIFELDLSNLNLTEIPSEINELIHLNTIILKFNKITEIKNLDALVNLSSLNLLSNQITEIKNLDALVNLSSLNLLSNQITEIKNLDALVNLSSLDLRANKITEIKNLDALVNLSSLRLSANKITEIKNLDALVNLSSLDLHSDQITEIKNLDALVNLSSLDLHFNKITEIKNLDALVNLSSLDLYYNQITEIKNLDALVNLSSLNLLSNQITEIKNLDALVNLSSLYLHYNQITEIKNLDALVNLSSLRLSANKITEIKNLDALVNLSSLDLSSNQITEIKNLDALVNLSSLYLNYNQITEIKNLDALVNLKGIDLQNNQIGSIKKAIKNLNFKYDEKFSFLYNLGINLFGNPLSLDFIEAIKSGDEAVQSYFANLSKGSKPLREVKLMILGEGEAGKSNLRNYIMGENFDPNKSATIGIHIDHRPLHIEDKNYRINIWDFGGQWMQEQVHRFFITEECVYVLMVKARTDKKVNDWLEWIKSHGQKSKIIIVANRIDEITGQSFVFPENQLKQEYPDLIHSFHYISLLRTYENNPDFVKTTQQLYDTIISCLLSLESIETAVPQNVYSLKEKLEDKEFKGKPYISHDYFTALADKEGIEGNKEYVINLFNKTGTIRHIKGSKYILNPEWVSGGIYQLIVSEFTEQLRGIVSKKDMDLILQKTEDFKFVYREDDYDFIMDLMVEFNLAARSQDRNTLFIPKQFNLDLLESLKESEIFVEDYIHFYLKYEGYFPDSLISQFIAVAFEDVHEQFYWQQGILLKDKEDHTGSTFALVKSDVYFKKIIIKVKGDTNSCQAYFKRWRRELKKLQESTHYQYDEMVVDHLHQVEISYEDLLIYKMDGTKFVPMINNQKKPVKIDVDKILRFVEDSASTEENSRQLNITNYYYNINIYNYYQQAIPEIKEQLEKIQEAISHLNTKSDIDELKAILQELRAATIVKDPNEGLSLYQKGLKKLKNFTEVIKSEGVKEVAKLLIYEAVEKLQEIFILLIKFNENGLNSHNIDLS
jgi:internalin A